MREIKFRGKLHDEDKWVYGYYAKTVVNDGVPLCLEDCRIHHIIIADGTMWFVIPETVGQYTGLHDKNGNGKEIYEDDVVMIDVEYDSFTDAHSVDKTFDIGRISWCESNLTWLADCFSDSNNNMPLAEYSNLTESDMVVIGDMHSNPELLKGGEPNA